MKIETASGHTILADDADQDLLSYFSWYASKQSGGRFYAHARIRGVGAPYPRVSMHQLLLVPPKGMVVHHKNNNGLDNRRCNLMVTTQKVNTMYAHINAKCVHRDGEYWRAQVRDETGKQVSIGVYNTEKQALIAVKNWKYRKMLELEAIGTSEAMQIAEALEQALLA
jgi:hypothetical protein